ncbi:MAG: hypothetical protein WC449_05785 [Candidatus Paceibacterota bacterium]
MSEEKQQHIHAELMALYAQDAMETDKPWKRWEHKRFQDNEWSKLLQNPVWLELFEYRRKPKTININGYEVPEPLRVKPECESIYYVASTSSKRLETLIIWNNDEQDNEWLNNGLIHLTKEAAKLHVDALLSFTRK